MLINKGVVSGEVVTIKLMSGDEIITKLIEDTPTGYKISKPSMITVTPQGLGLVPYVFTISPETEIIISKQAVVAVAATEKQFADQYIQNTTGIRLS
jgi:hypothetical protein